MTHSSSIQSRQSSFHVSPNEIKSDTAITSLNSFAPILVPAQPKKNLTIHRRKPILKTHDQVLNIDISLSDRTKEKNENLVDFEFVSPNHPGWDLNTRYPMDDPQKIWLVDSQDNKFEHSAGVIWIMQQPISRLFRFYSEHRDRFIEWNCCYLLTIGGKSLKKGQKMSIQSLRKLQNTHTIKLSKEWRVIGKIIHVNIYILIMCLFFRKYRADLDISHLCGNHACRVASHLCQEKHIINLSRKTCHDSQDKDNCFHNPPCFLTQKRKEFYDIDDIDLINDMKNQLKDGDFQELKRTVDYALDFIDITPEDRELLSKRKAEIIEQNVFNDEAVSDRFDKTAFLLDKVKNL